MTIISYLVAQLESIPGVSQDTSAAGACSRKKTQKKTKRLRTLYCRTKQIVNAMVRQDMLDEMR
jgi:hypothetical protein